MLAFNSTLYGLQRFQRAQATTQRAQPLLYTENVHASIATPVHLWTLIQQSIGVCTHIEYRSASSACTHTVPVKSVHTHFTHYFSPAFRLLSSLHYTLNTPRFEWRTHPQWSNLMNCFLEGFNFMANLVYYNIEEMCVAFPLYCNEA